MKKLTAILKNCQFADRLFNIREKKICTALDAARNDIEEQKMDAEIEYEKLMNKLGDKAEVNYKSVFNQMIKAKDTIRNADSSLVILDEIQKELNSEVEIEKAE